MQKFLSDGSIYFSSHQNEWWMKMKRHKFTNHKSQPRQIRLISWLILQLVCHIIRNCCTRCGILHGTIRIVCRLEYCHSKLSSLISIVFRLLVWNCFYISLSCMVLRKMCFRIYPYPALFIYQCISSVCILSLTLLYAIKEV